jgi:hypothetical protein
MSKKAISGVLSGTGATPANGYFNPPFVEPDSEYWANVNRESMEEIERRRAIDLLSRARARAARNRHNAEGFGE